MTLYTSKPQHNYHWLYKGGEVTVTCTKCRVSATFLTAKWDECVGWCNQHTKGESLGEATMRPLRTVAP